MNVTQLQHAAGTLFRDSSMSGESRPLVLSLFPGIDLLGRAFTLEGACVVKGPDLILGERIEDFTPVAGVLTGIIGGSPCQDFSKARRAAPTGDGERLLAEFVRCVEQAGPEWFLHENVPGVPDVTVRGYEVQRFFLNARDCGCTQHRHRRIQFGSLDGVGLRFNNLPGPPRSHEPCCTASEGTRQRRRAWADFCVLQGLPMDFELPGWSVAAKYRAVGNGVPIPMGRVLAIAINRRHVTLGERICICGCGRVPPAYGIHHNAACRKRMERKRRDAARVTGSGTDTPA